MMIQAHSIKEVIAHLDEIILWSKTHNSRIGYFATLYRKMTIAVQQGILKGTFEDGKRMEQLDVIFANRYLQAWEAYVNKQKCTTAWCTAFDACSNTKLIVLQHILLGVNTHINLDLAIAAAQTSPGNKIHALQKDFTKINDIIEAMTQEIQDTLCGIWPPLLLLGKISNNREKAVINFSITTARTCSWVNALALAALKEADQKNYIQTMDRSVVVLAERILDPGFLVSRLLQPIVRMEDANVSRNINLLH